MFMLWYAYVSLCLCSGMFMHCYVMFCYAYVLFVCMCFIFRFYFSDDTMRLPKEYRIDYKPTSSKRLFGIIIWDDNSVSICLGFVMFMCCYVDVCYVYVLLCLCFVMYEL